MAHITQGGVAAEIGSRGQVGVLLPSKVTLI
jgi:hypothetical protein